MTTNVFEKNLEAYINKVQLIINQGGTRSSKTYSILQLLYHIARTSKKKLIISVVSRALPHLKLGAIRDFDNILLSYNINPDKVKNKTDMYYTIGNSIIEFFGADQPDKVHGPSRDILFINEANFIKYEIYDQLAIRTTGTIILDYNPTTQFWVHDDIMPNEKHLLIKSTYLDNNFLSAQQIARIEAKKQNENWWRVYGMGEIGQLEGAIFSNWTTGEFDLSIPFGYGLDFGYYPDPDCLVKVAVDNKRMKMYWNEKIYTNYQGTNDLKENMMNYCKRHDLIIADSSEKRLISDLEETFPQIRAVSKRPGSVSENLKLMQDYEHILTETSHNLAKEFTNYIWNDKKAGIPIDGFNHGIDAGRYYFMEQRNNDPIIF